MSPEIYAASAPVIAVNLALAALAWRVLARMFADVTDRLDRVDARLDRVDARLDKVDVRLDGLEKGLLRVDGRVDVLEGRLGRLEVRFDALDHKVDELAKDHRNLARELSEFRGEMSGRLDSMAARA